MTNFNQIADDINASVGRFKVTFDVECVSIKNFLQKIKIDELKNKIKHKNDLKYADVLQLMYYLSDFNSEIINNNKMNDDAYDEIKKSMSALKNIHKQQESAFHDQEQYIIEISNEKELLKKNIQQFQSDIEKEKEKEIQQIRSYFDINKEIQQYKSENPRMSRSEKKKIDTLFQDYASFRSEIENINELKTKLSNANKELVKIKQEKNNVIAKENQLLGLISQNKEKISELNTKINMQDQLITLQKEIIFLQDTKIDDFKKMEFETLLEPDKSKSSRKLQKESKLKQENQVLQKKNQLLQQDIDNNKKEFDELKLNVQSLREALQTKNEQISLLNKQIKSIQQNEKPTPNCQAYQMNDFKIESQPNAINNQNQSFQQTTYMKENSIGQIDQQNNNNEQLKMQSLQDALYDKETQIEALKAQIGELNQHILQLSNQMSKNENEIAESNKQKESNLIKENMMYKDSISEKMKKIQYLANKNSELESLYDEEKRKFSDKEKDYLNQIETREQQIKFYKNEIEQINNNNKNQIKNFDTEKKDYLEKISLLSGKIEKMKADKKNKYKADYESLTTLVQQQKETIEELERASKLQSDNIDNITAENTDLKQTVSDLESTSQTQKEKISNITKEKTDLEARVRKLTQDYSDLEKIKKQNDKLIKSQKEIINKQMILAKIENEKQIRRMKHIQQREINSIIEAFS